MSCIKSTFRTQFAKKEAKEQKVNLIILNRKILINLLTLITLFQLEAWAGDGGLDSGGSIGVLCTSSSKGPKEGFTLEIAEQYEARKLGLNFPKATGNIDQEILNHGPLLINYLTSKNEFQFNVLKNAFNEFKDDPNLPLTNDYNLLVNLDPGCRVVQLAANKQNENGKFQFSWNYNYIRNLDTFGLFLVLAHELFYSIDRVFDNKEKNENFSIHTTSDLTRKILMYLYSGRLQISRHGFPLSQIKENKLDNQFVLFCHFGGGNSLGGGREPIYEFFIYDEVANMPYFKNRLYKSNMAPSKSKFRIVFTHFNYHTPLFSSGIEVERPLPIEDYYGINNFLQILGNGNLLNFKKEHYPHSLTLPLDDTRNLEMATISETRGKELYYKVAIRLFDIDQPINSRPDFSMGSCNWQKGY